MPTTPGGYSDLGDWVSELAGEGQVVLAIEGSRHYGLGLSRFLSRRGQRVVEIDSCRHIGKRRSASRVADRRSVRVEMGVHPDNQTYVVHHHGPCSLRSRCWGTAPAWRELPRQSRDGSRPLVDQAPDQANEGGQAGAGNVEARSLAKHATQAVRFSDSHSASPTQT